MITAQATVFTNRWIFQFHITNPFVQPFPINEELTMIMHFISFCTAAAIETVPHQNEPFW